MKARLVVALALTCASIAALPAPAHAESGDPVGSLDGVGIRLPIAYYNIGWWVARGWAADPDAPGNPIDVHVYVDGQFYTAVRTGDAATPLRPDVAKEVTFAGDKAGWQATITGDPEQSHTLCAYAINYGPGSENTTLGCIEYGLGRQDFGDPRGRLEAVTSTPGLVRFQGWIGDPDDDAVGPMRIRPFLDGNPYDSFFADVARPDVNQGFPDLDAVGQFDGTLGVPPGQHIYCVDVENAGGTGSNNTSLGCGLIDVPDPDLGDVQGYYESMTDDVSRYPLHQLTFEGWAWDPTGDPPAVVRTRYFYVGFTTGFLRQQVIEDFQTSVDRPDVQRVFPDAPANTGWRVRHDLDYTRATAPTEVDRCWYVLQRDPPGTERLLGCTPIASYRVGG